MPSRSDNSNVVRRCFAYVAAWWYFFKGIYLQCSGERGAWHPACGEHHLFGGIQFASGAIEFTDAQTGKQDKVHLAGDFSEKSMLADSGEIVRLASAGLGRATLIHPDGRTEQLRANRYGTDVYRHAVIRYVQSKQIGGATWSVRRSGDLTVDGTPCNLLSSSPWAVRLPDGSTLQYKPFGQLILVGHGCSRTYVWAAKELRLLEVDYSRVEYSWSWATSESESSSPLLDGLITVHPEDGAVQVMHHSVFQHREAIDWVGPNGLRITRVADSDRLYAYQDKTLIGVAEFVPNGGYSDKTERTYNRWRFSPGNPVREPVGTGWYSPTTTAAILTVPAVVAASLMLGDLAAYAIATPVVAGIIAIFVKNKLRESFGYIIPS